ncbi:unnamed protein product [Clonostachys byssicola]|uniref:Zn(2)-C6 fungal-type domain-containing protein n=1 Tax=Clonostachys byssicola TaxID=160290 RepID=A0A9N9U914_9HYPO|nr:unnamed protein product [Clonostachys byssicola]
MRRHAGPLDKRKKVTRCQSCSKRRIKCEGGFPCEYCIRTKKQCHPPGPSPQEIEFAIVGNLTRPDYQTLASPALIPRPNESLYLDHFALFVERCQFTKGFATVSSDLLPLISSSKPLKDLALAIGALEASRRGYLHTHRGADSPQVASFGFYGRSIEAFQKQIQTSQGIEKEDVLWTTLFLGIFDLMSENSGDGWANHMSYGVSRILQAVKPVDDPSPLRMTLLDAFKTLEANRAILYGNGSFLGEECWSSHLPRPITQPPGTMPSIIQLMLEVSSFSQRFFEGIESIASDGRPFHPFISELAVDGCRLHEKLESWYSETAPRRDESDPYTKLALAIYHALALFLVGNYGYYSCWEGQRLPSLSLLEVESHSNRVMSLSVSILENSHISGTLILFPLRVAGLYSTEEQQRGEILGLLGRIQRQGFNVAERIQGDLRQCWNYQDSHSSLLRMIDNVSEY